MLNNQKGCSVNLLKNLSSNSLHLFGITNQAGRSMIEMLGVLAIIGVLSVAAISGYNFAMKKYRINEIISTATTLYMLAEAGNLSGNLKGASYNTETEQEINLEKASIPKPFDDIDMYYEYGNENVVGIVHITGAEKICEAIKNNFYDDNDRDFDIECGSNS